MNKYVQNKQATSVPLKMCSASKADHLSCGRIHYQGESICLKDAAAPRFAKRHVLFDLFIERHFFAFDRLLIHFSEKFLRNWTIYSESAKK